MLHMLADAAALLPTTSRADPEPLLPLAYSFASEVYPELLSNDVNQVPWWLTWITAFPSYTRRGTDRWLWLLLRTTWIGLSFLPLIGSFLGPLMYLLILANSQPRRRRQRWRKRLAALLSVRYGLAPGGLAMLLEDDDAFSLLLQRFLAEHQVPYRLPLYDRDGPYLFAAPEKIPALATALQRAIGRGRDNELFVLCVDLLELDDALGELLRTVHVALSRHHQVLIVCPWPPGVPLPVPDPADVHSRPPSTLAGMLAAAARAADFTLRSSVSARSFGRLGVPVVCAASDEAVPLILERINRLRTLRRTPR